jgi:hypothetical protein
MGPPRFHCAKVMNDVFDATHSLNHKPCAYTAGGLLKDWGLADVNINSLPQNYRSVAIEQSVVSRSRPQIYYNRQQGMREEVQSGNKHSVVAPTTGSSCAARSRGPATLLGSASSGRYQFQGMADTAAPSEHAAVLLPGVCRRFRGTEGLRYETWLLPSTSV